MNTVPILYS